MNKIEKMKRNQKIKETFFKCLHIISYILATLFIIIAIVSGVQSCSKKQDSKPIQNKLPSNSLKVKNNALDFSNLYVYEPRYSGTQAVNFDNLMTYFDISLNTFDYVQPTIIKQVYFTDDVSLYRDNVFVDNITRCVFVFACIDSPNGDYWYRFDYMTFVNADNTGWYDYATYFDYYDGENRVYEYSFTRIQLVLSNSSLDDSITYFFSLSTTTNFVFNDPFNYNAPFNFSLTAGSFPHSYDSQTNLYELQYDLPYFISNGQIFNRIKLTYINAYGNYFLDSNNKVVRGSNTYITFVGMTYHNTNTNTYVYACDRYQQAMTDDNGQWYMVNFNSVTWSNFNYRYLTFLSSLTDEQLNNLNRFNNNYDSSYTIDVSGTLSVFTLLSNAFYSLSAFWSIMILPGITIGTLFFLPLVMMIILTLVYLLRK